MPETPDRRRTSARRRVGRPSLAAWATDDQRAAFAERLDSDPVNEETTDDG